MWFGTETGLYRYDGYEYKVFRYDPDDSISISGNMIREILFEDVTGNLWIGTFSNGLNKFNPATESFTRYIKEPGNPLAYDFNRIFSAIQDKDENIWIAASRGFGLIKFNEATGEYTSYLPDTANHRSLSNEINSIYEDNKGIFWIGTNKGLFLFNKNQEVFGNIESKSPLPDEFKNATISSIVKDKDETIWIGTSNGLFKYSLKNNTLKQFKYKEEDENSLNNNFIRALFENPLDSGRSLWIFTVMGLNKFDKDTEKVNSFNYHPNDSYNIIYGGTYDMFLGSNGTLWLGTDYLGAIKMNLEKNPFSEHKIGPFQDDQFQHQYAATSFLEDSRGNFWVGTAFGGLMKYDQEMDLIARYEYDPTNQDRDSIFFVFSLFEDSDSVIWAGTTTNLNVFDLRRNQFSPCLNPPIDNIQFHRINDIFQDSHGLLWVSSNIGLFYQQKQELYDTTFQRVPGISTERLEIRSICEDRFGSLWLGSVGQGLFQLTPENRESKTFINYRHDARDHNSLSSDIVFSVFIDKEGTLWCGTTTGLNRISLNDVKFTCFNLKNGLIANFIYHIEEDNNGNLWLSTERGIIRFRQISDSTAVSKLYERSDGIPFEDNYPYKFYKSREGKIFVGGRRGSGNGFYSFFPDSLKDNDHIPPVVLTKFLINNIETKLDSSISFTQHIDLRYDQNFFSIEFAALDYINPPENKYAYMLEGLDQDWIYCNNWRLANYTNVPPGDYIFRAKGSNNDGLWNEQGASLKITIFPPPWKTWWAYSLYLLFIILILIIVIRYYLRRQRLLHELALEQVQTEKLEEMDRLKSRFFANISHEFRTPLTLILGPLKKLRTQISGEAKKDLDMMQRNAQRLQNLINQLLSLSKLESGKMKLQAQEVNIVSLVNRYVQSFESLAKQKKIDLRFTSDMDAFHLFVDKDKIGKILYNLLSNAFKFTGEGGRIAVTITPLNPPSRGDLLLADPLSKRSAKSPPFRGDGRGVQIKITDTGPGIPPEKLPHIFDRFYQADDSYTKNQEGTGIGLALTKELVELHHGEITVQSDVGKGTTFTVTLPLGKEHLQPDEIGGKNGISNTEHRILNVEVIESEDLRENTAEKKILNLDPQRSTFDTEAKPLLLLVEDNSDLRSYICDYLDESYQVIEAVDGKEGLEQALEQIPDLVISDVMMPKMDGYEFCRKLKTDERTSHIPVILLTAKAAMEDKLEGLETGADDFLTKPFDPDELLVRISNLIKQRKKLKEIILKNIGYVNQLSISGITSMDQKFLKKAVDVVEKYISDAEFTVELFGTEMAMSRVQLHRKLTALVEQPASEFIRTIRLNRAAILLKEKSGNIAEIAYGVGFNNPSYFSECFRKQFGKLPSEYID